MNSTPNTMTPPADVDHFRPLRLSDLWEAFWHRRRSAIVVAILLMPIFIVGVFLIPAQFDSYAQLLIRLGRGAVALDPTTSLSPTVSLQDSRSSQVNSVKEMLQSRALADKVVTKIGADRVLESHSLLGKTMGQVSSLLPASDPKPLGDMSAEDVSQQIDKEMAILKFHQMMNLSVAGDAYTISLEVRSEDPFLSRDLLATLLSEYQKHHAAAHSSVGSYDFFKEQAEVAYERAIAAKEALRSVKTKRGIIDVGSSQGALRSLLSEVESSLLQTDNSIASTQAEMERIVEQMDGVALTVESEVIRGISKSTGNTMRQSLYNLEVSYNELAVKYKADHPKLRALREQLEAASKIASTERGEQPQTRESINPVRQQLEISRRQAMSNLAGLKSRREQLVTQKEEFLQDLDALNGDEVELTRLSWEANLAEGEYMRAAEARDNAETINKLSSGQVSEIAIVQEASLGLKKVKPRRGTLLILAAILAVAMGVFQALVRGLLAPQPHEIHADMRSQISKPRFDDGHYNGQDGVGRSHGPPKTDETEGEPAIPGVPR